jgi:glycosyltransferase involved in cell wall biosynthesis
MPDRPRAPKVAVWTPLPPQHTGIADNVAVLLPELGRLVDVTVVVEDWLVGLATPPDRTTLIGHSSYATRRDDFDLCVYHMGNHYGFHGWMYDELLQTPGLVVLHDLNLSGFFGESPRDVPRATSVGRAAAMSREVESLSSRFVVEASRTTLVHSPWAARLVGRHCPATPVVSAHLAAPPPDRAADASSIRRACGWDSEHFVVGAVGGFGQHKRPDLAVRAFAALHEALPAARLLLAGWVHDPTTL